jgi:DNA-binding LacI/PurR family transcriptional regulator
MADAPLVCGSGILGHVGYVCNRPAAKPQWTLQPPRAKEGRHVPVLLPLIMSRKRIGPLARPTSIDVARAAGVSQSTVSRAFTPGASITEGMRRRVEAAADALGYSPNAFARGMITPRSRIVGVMMGDVTNPLYAAVLACFAGRLRQAGQRVLFASTDGTDAADSAVREILEYNPDAIVLSQVTPSDGAIRRCAAAGTRVVLLNRFAGRADASSVRCDDAGGGRIAADLLLDAGHRRPALISGIATTWSSGARGGGFIRQVKARGLPPPPVEPGGYTYQGGYDAALQLLRRRPRPDAIFCANDMMALGALDAARLELGLDVPRQLSIVGFDGIPAASWASYDLTTLHQPVEEIVDCTMAVLLTLLEDPHAAHTDHFVPVQLVLRGSARLPRGLGRSSVQSAVMPPSRITRPIRS